MYWTAKNPYKMITVRKFALIPRRCEHDHYHWLEMVHVNRKYIAGSYSSVDVNGNYHGGVWNCNCNLDKEYDV